METLYLVSESQLKQIQGRHQPQTLAEAVIEQDRPEAVEVIALDRLAAETLQRKDLTPWAKAERLANNLHRFVQLKPQAFPDPEKLISPARATTLDDTIWEEGEEAPWVPTYPEESPTRHTAKKPHKEQTPRKNLFSAERGNAGSAFKNVQSRRRAPAKKTYSPDIGDRLQPAREVKLLNDTVIQAMNKKRSARDRDDDEFSTPNGQTGNGWITI
jgi:hypothetical protein